MIKNILLLCLTLVSCSDNPFESGEIPLSDREVPATENPIYENVNPPEELFATVGEVGYIELSWKLVDGIFYTITRSDEADGDFKEVGYTDGENSFTDTYDLSSINYYYKVYAIDDNGIFSPPSETVIGSCVIE